MKLPNFERSFVDVRKLRDYCLDPESPKGQAKARVFKAALGFTQSDADILRDALLRAARDVECVAGERDQFGQRYTLDFDLELSSGRARVRSGWIVKTGEDFPRLTTCYVLKKERKQ
jgi:hypothetical protein